MFTSTQMQYKSMSNAFLVHFWAAIRIYMDEEKKTQIRFILFHFIPWTAFNGWKKKSWKTSQTDLPGKPIKKRTNIFMFVCFFSVLNSLFFVFFYLNTFVVSPVGYLFRLSLLIQQITYVLWRCTRSCRMSFVGWI